MGDKFNKECLERHNHWRAKHGCPPLKFNQQLSNAAQKWATSLASMGCLQHSPESQGKTGENVAMKWVQGGGEFSGSQVTDKWYSEIEDYKFGVENQINCGHFSQVVWKSSTDAGFGRAVDPNGKVFAVGQYLPPANFANKWAANVPPPISGKIEVPTDDDIMGQQQQSHHREKAHGELKPKDDADSLVGKQTKTKTSGGVKTVILTETYERPDGSTYSVTRETTQGTGGATQLDMGKKIEEQNGRFAENNEEKASAINIDAFREDVLEAHNAYRKIYRAPALTPDSDLDAIAQQWADHLASTDSFKHSTSTRNGKKLGENIACKWGSCVEGCEGREVVHQWYDEESKFTYGENPTSLEAGHFTQVVWKASARLGVGFARSASGKFITVCNYEPAGNIMGQFPANVPFPQ